MACVPLTDADAPCAPRPAPFGALTVAFRSGTIPKDTILAVHALARALSSPACRLRLTSHVNAMIESLLAPPHFHEEDDLAAGPSSSTPPQSSDDLSDSGPSHLPLVTAPCCACDDNAVDTPALQPPSPTFSNVSSDSGWSSVSGAHSAEEQHPLWLTFKSPALERNYTKWVAMHMRHLDPAAALFSCSYFVAMGFSPSFAMALRHPGAWAAGWAALVPMWLCLLPPTARIYLARREACLAVFHVLSLAWQVATLNGTSLLGPTLFAHFGPCPAACLSWQVANLYMFQMRWWQMVFVAAFMFTLDVVAVAAPLCRLFDASGVPQTLWCASTVVAVGALQLGVALGILRLNECRIRRLFLEHLEAPPEKRRAKFWFLRRFKLLGEGGMPVAVEMPRGAGGGKASSKDL